MKIIIRNFSLLTIMIAVIAGCASPPPSIQDPGMQTSDILPPPQRSQAPDYPGRADGELFLWEMTRDESSVFVLGSVHLGGELLYPLDQRIYEKFSMADALIVEADIINVDIAEVQAFINQNSTLADGEDIEDYLTPEDSLTLREIFQSYGIDYNGIRNLQPWVIANTLATISTFEANLDPSLGVDIHFATRAMEAGIETLAFETAVGQLEMLNSFSMEAQLWSLEDSIREFDSISEYISDLIEIWVAGDVAALEDLLLAEYFESDAGQEYFSRLLVDRNIDWIDTLNSLLSQRSQDTFFVVVGSAHLVGPDSLIELMIEDGFSARRF